MADTKIDVSNEELSKALDSIDTMLKSMKGKEEKKEDDKEKKDDDCDKDDDKMKSEAAKVADLKKAETFEAEVMKSEAVKQTVEVSDFLSELVKSIGSSLDSLKAELVKSTDAQTQAITQQQEHTLAIAKSLQSLSTAVVEVTKRQDELEKQPLGLKKSVTAVATERTFAKGDDGKPQLTKAQVSNKLTDLVMKSESVEGVQVTSYDISRWESASDMRPELKKAIFG